MASPGSIRELRYKSHEGTLDTFANGSDSSWKNATKLRIVDFDDSGLTQEGIPDEEIMTRMYDSRAPIAGLHEGSLKFSIYAGGAWANIGDNPEVDLIEQFCLGKYAPQSERTGTVGSGTMSTTNCAYSSANAALAVGQAVLFDSNTVHIVTSCDGSGFTFTPAKATAPAENDEFTIATTVYIDEDLTQRYIDTYTIGHASQDHVQTLDGVGTFTISGMTPGEVPKIDIDVMSVDHRHLNAGQVGTLWTNVTREGTAPSASTSGGSFHFGDTASTTASYLKAGEFEINPGLAFEPIPDPNKANGKGGFQMVPGKPSISFTALYDEDTRGMIDDFVSGTDKRLILAAGKTATKCFAIDAQKCHVTSRPVRQNLGNLSAVRITVECQENVTSQNCLEKSAFRMHWL